eukprot:Em0001g2748a
MGPKADQRKKGLAMQETRKETSPDWVAEGGIHSVSNPHPSRANAEFDQKRLTLALVAHKAENKIPGPPSMAEREKSPVTAVETAKVANSPAHMAIRHAVPEEGFLNGTSLEVAEMETSPPSTPNSVAAGELVRTSSEVPAIRLQQDVALPQTRSKLVWGLLSSLRRDTNTNPASSPHGAGEESQTGQLGRAGRSAQPEGEAYVRCLDMQKVAGIKLTTLLVNAGKVQLRINGLKQSLADGLFPPSFAPKAVPFGEATEMMQARWRALDNSFWKQRTELAVVFESENSEKANEEVASHLEGITKFLRGKMHPARNWPKRRIKRRRKASELPNTSWKQQKKLERGAKVNWPEWVNTLPNTLSSNLDRKAETGDGETPDDAGPSNKRRKPERSPKRKHMQAKKSYKPPCH